jgi:hypothetical protein
MRAGDAGRVLRRQSPAGWTGPDECKGERLSEYAERGEKLAISGAERWPRLGRETGPLTASGRLSGGVGDPVVVELEQVVGRCD